MDVIFESGLQLAAPFFSVCIETNNRGKTIFRSLESLSNQLFKNFECIVVDDRSSDETMNEINRFINSSLYSNSPFSLKVYQNKKQLGAVFNWNKPLEHAKAKYIAVLEGDDYFHNEHLQKANAVLEKIPTLGIYATGNQLAPRPLTGIIPAKEYFKYNYRIINVSPPSETIFIRLNKNNVPYTFDVINNIYAPEHDLWMRIANDGWDAYHTDSADVYREPSTSFSNRSWKFYEDKFKIIEKYRTNAAIDKNDFNTAFKKQFIAATRRYLVGTYNKQGDPESIKQGLFSILKNKNIPSPNLYSGIFKSILVQITLYTTEKD